jgi:hypothetical protein
MRLEQIRKEILRLFRNGKISDAHYTILDQKTTDYISLGLIDTDHEKKSNYSFYCNRNISIEYY